MKPKPQTSPQFEVDLTSTDLTVLEANGLTQGMNTPGDHWSHTFTFPAWPFETLSVQARFRRQMPGSEGRYLNERVPFMGVT